MNGKPVSCGHPPRSEGVMLNRELPEAQVDLRGRDIDATDKILSPGGEYRNGS